MALPTRPSCGSLLAPKIGDDDEQDDKQFRQPEAHGGIPKSCVPERASLVNDRNFRECSTFRAPSPGSPDEEPRRQAKLQSLEQAPL